MEDVLPPSSSEATETGGAAPYVNGEQLADAGQAPLPDADADWVQPRDGGIALLGGLDELLEGEYI